MQGYRRWGRPGADYQLPAVQVREGGLNGAAAQAGRAGQGLMTHPDRCLRLIDGAPQQAQVDDERRRPPIVADEIGHDGIDEHGIQLQNRHPCTISLIGIAANGAIRLRAADLASGHACAM